MRWQHRQIQVIVTSKTLIISDFQTHRKFSVLPVNRQSTLNKRYSPVALYTYTPQALLLCDSKIAAFLQSMSLQRSLILICESEKLYRSVQPLATVFPKVFPRLNAHFRHSILLFYLSRYTKDTYNRVLLR